MAIIDLIVKKPALKRTEVVEADTQTESTATEETDAEAASTEESAAETASGSSSRLRRGGKVVATIAVGVLGLLTLRKLRARRKASREDEPVDLEE